MTEYTARLLTVDDGTAWHALLCEGARDFPDGFLVSDEEAQAMDPARIDGAMQRGTMHGVFDGETLVGFGGLSRGGTRRIMHRGTIGPFYVTASAQGTQAANVLMTGLKAAARAGKMTQLMLWVSNSNGRAMRFYERHSFEAMGIIPNAVVMEDGTSRPDIIMLRGL